MHFFAFLVASEYKHFPKNPHFSPKKANLYLGAHEKNAIFVQKNANL